MIADPRVHGVSVTGSERAGAAVAEIAGRNLKKVVLELGGSDPFILLGTDDLDAAVAGGGRSAARQHRPVLQRGQALHRRRRALRRVPREVHSEQMGAAKPGDPTAEDTAIGPLSSKTRGRPARGPGQAGGRQRRRGRRRRQARRQLLRTDDPRPGSSPATRPPRKSSSARSRRSTGSAPRRRRSSSPTRPRSGSAPT